MKQILIRIPLIFLTSLFSCKSTSEGDALAVDRILYIANLRSEMDEKVWPGFSDPHFEVPLIYYTGGNCYVTNPTNKFIDTYHPELLYKSNALLIFKTGLVDSIPFHMETSISLGDSTPEYNYNAPFMNCSSPELTANFIPDVHSTEMWASMVIHEYFHGFQFKHNAFLRFYEANVAISADTLKSLYRKYTWYKEGVDKENELLLGALNAESDDDIRQHVIQFFALRDQRFAKTEDTLTRDISIIEKSYETMEGTARYMEYGLYQKFATQAPDIRLSVSDSLFNSYAYFKHYSIDKDEWLYTTGINFYYSTGFNIARLLDKLNVDFKDRLFSEPTSLDEILREQMRNGVKDSSIQ